MHQKKNIVFIATSLDGYIADSNGRLEWLNTVPNPEANDMGFNQIMESIDAVVMGRNTFETVASFEGPWPYRKPVYVLSHSLKSVPESLRQKVTIQRGNVEDVISEIHKNGHHKLYIDGGRVIQSFLAAGLIDELTITTIPILLGGGIPLFDGSHSKLPLEHMKTEVFLNQIVQSTYRVL